jgi:GT2 family glycosyltransferase
MPLPPRVDILLLNWNGASDTIECLASVFALDYPDFRVIVCDNGSTDGSMARLQAWAADARRPAAMGGAPIAHVRYDRATAEAGGVGRDADASLVLVDTGANLGFAGGNNVGLRFVLARPRAEYVWLLNNDTVVAPGALRALVARAEADPGVGAVGGTLLRYDQPDRVQYQGVAAYSAWHGMVTILGRDLPASARRAEPPRFDFVSGACFLARAAALEHVGLLDDRFFLYGEDIDWSVRIRQAGLRLAYAPDAEVWHKGSATVLGGSPMHDYHNVRSSLMLVLKHHRWRAPVAVAYSLYRCLLPKLVRGERRRFAAVLRAYRDVVRGHRLRPPPSTPTPASPREPRVRVASSGVS